MSRDAQLQQFKALSRTRYGRLLVGIIELGLAYWLLSLAINSGSLWQWILGIGFTIGGIQNLFKSVWSLVHGKN